MKKEICALMLGGILCFAVQASAKEIIYNNVDAKISLNSDGSAIVTETWTMNFVNNRFTSFIKAIDCDVSKLKNMEVVLDGVQCAETEDGDEKPVWTYEVGKKDGETAVSCYFDQSGAEHILELRYIVKNLVSFSKDAQVDYVLVNENFNGNIRGANIEIEFPYPVDEKDIAVNELTLNGVSGNSVYISGSRMDGARLAVSVNAPEYIFSEKNNVISKRIIGVISIMFAALLMIAFIFRKNIKYSVFKAGTVYRGMKDTDIAQRIYSLNGVSDFIRTDKKYLMSKKSPISAFLWLMAKGVLYCDSFGTVRISDKRAENLNQYDAELAENISGLDGAVCLEWVCCILKGERSSLKNERNISKLKSAFSAYKKQLVGAGMIDSREIFVAAEACRKTGSVPYHEDDRLSEYGALVLSEPDFKQDLTQYISGLIK